MHGSATPRLEHEVPSLGDDAQVRRYKDTLWAKRVGKAWGLVEWTVHTMRKWGASILLIEGKASGLTVHQELRRLQRSRRLRRGWFMRERGMRGWRSARKVIAAL